MIREQQEKRSGVQLKFQPETRVLNSSEQGIRKMALSEG